MFASKDTLETITFKYDGDKNKAMCLTKGDQIVNITSFKDFKSADLQKAMNEDDTSSPAIIVCDLVS